MTKAVHSRTQTDRQETLKRLAQAVARRDSPLGSTHAFVLMRDDRAFEDAPTQPLPCHV
jgi:hypothetical protein